MATEVIHVFEGRCALVRIHALESVKHEKGEIVTSGVYATDYWREGVTETVCEVGSTYRITIEKLAEDVQ